MSSPSSTRASRDKHVSAGKSNLGRLGERSSKELFEQLVLLLYGTSTILLIALVFKAKNIKKAGPST